MNHSIRSAAIPLAIASLARIGDAHPLQANPSNPQLAQGMFSNFAVGITVGGVSSPDPLLIRAPGVNAGVPTAWSAGAFTAASPLHPDYTMAALTHWAGGSGVSFGGISTGGEVMPSVDASGRLQMVSTNWYMISISLDSAAQGQPGSIVDLQTQIDPVTQIARDASGDILSYYTIGSQGINTAYVDKTWLESSREQLKLDLIPTPPTSVRSIQNLDYGMGVISVDPLARAGSMFPVRDCFYFTLTESWLTNHPGFQLGGQLANASTVFAMKWTATSVPPWSAPVVAFDHSMLFPGKTPGSIEIDALSIDKGNGTWDAPSRVVLSLTPASDLVGPYDQILVYQRYTTTEVRPLATDPAFPPSELISEKLGLLTVAGEGGDPDNVTGTCGGDPIERYRIYPVVAVATDKLKAGAGTLGFSGLRTCNHPPPSGSTSDTTSPDDFLHLQITGMDFGQHMFGIVQLYTESDAVDPGSTPGPSTPWGSPILIDGAAQLRNTIELTCPLSCAILGKSFRCSAELIALDFNPGLVVTPLRSSCVLSIEH